MTAPSLDAAIRHAQFTLCYRASKQELTDALKGLVAAAKEAALRGQPPAPTATADRLVREVAEGGVEFEDERVRYVAVQIDRETWAEVKTYAAGTAPADSCGALRRVEVNP